MDNPVLVEVTRGNRVESRHRGAFVIIDAGGQVVAASGDIERPVFPRSAVKAIQALPLVESGAADAFGFGEADLALACASHSGEPGHVERAAAMLASAGLSEADLECGSHWAADPAVLIEQARAMDRPGQLHNNCSGKHAGFLCTCRHLDFGTRGYVTPGHAEQRLIAETMTAVTGAAHDAGNAATDGCAIPTYAVPLTALAEGFARMATGQGLEPVRAAAARRLLAACMADPWFMAGTDRFDTRVMQAAPGRVFLKIGAEGVFCAALPDLGLGIALKADDGAERAAETMVAAVLAYAAAGRDDDLAACLETFARRPVLNRNGETVGEIRPAAPLA